MLPFRIAFRFLRTSPGQSILIVFGIGVGIGVVIFVQSILVSLQQNTLDTVIGSSSHITLKAIKNGDPITYSQAVKDVVTKDPRIKTVVPVDVVSALYTSGSESAPLTLIGGDLKQLDTIYKLSDRLKAGKASLAPGEIMVGTNFADKYGVKPGDNIQVKFPQGGTTTLRISGIFDLGSAAFNENTAFVNQQLNAAKLGYSGDKYSQIQMQLVDPFKAKSIADSWGGLAAFAGVDVRNWQDDNKQIVTAVASQGYSGYMIEGFVLIAVALGIASTLAISAVQKTRQIGILKAMGMGDRPSGLIFFWQAAMLGFAGSVAGIVVGIGLVYLFKLSPVPFVINVDWPTVASAGVIGLIVSLASSFVPIRSTSRLDPIEVIQGV
jgi:lipoprotein-releasing system permease protein